MRVLVVRHAQKNWKPGKGITLIGEQQASATAQKLKESSAELILFSPTDRTLETAEIIARAVKAPLKPEERLRSWSVHGMESLLQELSQAGYAEVIFVTHQPIIRSLVSLTEMAESDDVACTPWGSLLHLPLLEASITRFEYTKSKLTLVAFAQSDHLPHHTG